MRSSRDVSRRSSRAPVTRERSFFSSLKLYQIFNYPSKYTNKVFGFVGVFRIFFFAFFFLGGFSNILFCFFGVFSNILFPSYAPRFHYRRPYALIHRRAASNPRALRGSAVKPASSPFPWASHLEWACLTVLVWLNVCHLYGVRRQSSTRRCCGVLLGNAVVVEDWVALELEI